MADHATYLRLTMVATGITLVVILLGAWTRLVDAGLGCPDWPGCYGQLGIPDTAEEIAKANELYPYTPVEVDKAAAEMVHRYAAGTLGLVILALGGLAYYLRRQGAKLPFIPAMALVVLVMAQATAGALTVTMLLWPQIVTLHLLGGFFTLALLAVLLARLLPANLGAIKAAHRRPASLLAALMLAALLAQITLGGWLSTNYAAIACPDFPKCQGQWWPDADFAAGFNITAEAGGSYLGGQLDSQARIAIHLTHRVGALLLSVLFIACLYMLWRWGLKRSFALWLLGLFGLQIGLGIANIIMYVPVSIATAHNGAAAVLFALTLVLNDQLSNTMQHD